MSHLSFDELWSFAGEAAPGDAAAGHLAGCAECQGTLSEIRVARSALAALPPAPELPRAVALRVGEALAARADARSLRSWFSFLFEPRLALVALGLLALLGAGAWLQLRGGPPSAPSNPQLALEPLSSGALPAPSPTLPQPPLPPPRRLTASVTSATRARAQNAAAVKAQVLEQGAKVATEPGGSLWMKLPDGSRAGLASASRLTLATLEQSTLALELEKGSLALDVPHRTDRRLTVTAGTLQILDLGTRFVVSRNDSRVLVAVQEGQVEVATPTSKQTVKAGHAVSWHDGKLDALSWETEKPQPAAPVAAPPSPSRLHEEEDSEPTPALDAEPEADEEPPPPAPPAPPPPPKAAPPLAAATAHPEEWVLPRGLGARPLASPDSSRRLLPPVNVPPPRRRMSLRELEGRLEALSRAFAGIALREARVQVIVRATDHGDCPHALPMADGWLREPVTGMVDEYRWRRVVLTQKLRCLNRLGRRAEALEVQRVLDMP